MARDGERAALNGPTMGTRWSAVAHLPLGADAASLSRLLQTEVDLVDAHMSSWKPDSDLMRLNRAPLGAWVDLPQDLMTVLAAGRDISRASQGAFELAVGDLVEAWGFGPSGGVDAERARKLLASARRSARDWLELDRPNSRARLHAPLTLDLNGIAKGYGVDRLAEALEANGVASYLVSIDGELRAGAPKPGGAAWTVAVEAPEAGVRRPAGVVALEAAALATSGDYRHRISAGGETYSHTMDSAAGRPLRNGVAAVTVRAGTCMVADAWATALLVLGPDRGLPLAKAASVEAMFALREADAAAT